jgi:hypothetical protein
MYRGRKGQAAIGSRRRKRRRNLRRAALGVSLRLSAFRVKG